MYAIKNIQKRDFKTNIILQNQRKLFISTKKYCCYLGEESMKTVLCPSKIGLRIV